jgi:RNA polymerase-associated protein CTR9
MMIIVFTDDNDKISLHSCLCWLYLRQLRSAPIRVPEDAEGQVCAKNQYHGWATQHGNKAIELDNNRGGTSGLTVLASGALSLAKGGFERALASFQSSLKQSGNANLFAQLGKARVLYQKKNYKGALELYQSVLSGRPNMKPDPRIGIGLCFWKLNDKETALLSWERALELDPKNQAVNTLIALYFMDRALSDVDSPEFGENYAAAMKYAQEAYKTNPNYSAAILIITSYLFSTKKMDSVLKLTQKVRDYADVPSLLSDGYFWMGRAHHFLQEYDKALEFYSLAEKKSNDKSNILPMLGKGLVQIAQDSPEALLTFENISSNNPKCSAAPLLLGIYTAHKANEDPKKKQRAISLLQKYLVLAKEQDETPPIEVFLTLAELHEDSNVTKAYGYLERITEYGYEDDFSFKLQNNLGVLNYLQGEFEAAKENFKSALELADKSDFPDSKLTVEFNIARLDDAMGNIDVAKEGYNNILKQQPDYMEAKLRLGYLAVVTGDENAGEELDQLMDVDGANLEARALYGWYLKRRPKNAKGSNDDAEQNHFKQSLLECDKHDIYSLISLGNLYLAVARSIKSSSSDTSKKDRTYFKAAELFDKALQLDKYNAYAAQGIAIILAETKRPEAALPIFNKIRETLDDLTIYINLGHCYVELREFPKAIGAYELALQKASTDDPQLLTLIGRAWYARGISEKSIEALNTSLSYSQRALKLIPDNIAMKFNVAFVQFQLAEFIRRVPNNKRTLEGIKEAQQGLEEAILTFRDIAKSRHPPFPANELEQRALMAENTVRNQLERTIADQESYENETQTKIEEAKKRRQAELERREEERRKQEEQEAERQRQLAEEREKLQEQAREWVEKAREEAERQEEETPKDKKKGSRKKKEDDIVVSDDEVEYENDNDTESKSNGKKKKYKSKEFISPSDEDESANEQEDDNDSERKRKAENETEPTPTHKKRRVIDDDDDDDEEITQQPDTNANGSKVDEDGDDDLFGDNDDE